MEKIKNYFINLILNWAVKRSAKRFAIKLTENKHEDYINYLYDLLIRDEQKMVLSKEGLSGYYDLDIEMNRILQTEIREYVRN